MKKLSTAFAFAMFLVGCSGNQPAVPAQTGPIKALGDAPQFDLEKIGGGRIKSEDIKGKVTVVDFWATWCQPCISEIPNYNKLVEENAGRDVQMFGVTFESGDIDAVTPKVAEFGIKYPVVMGTDEVSEGFGGYIGLPTTFLIGKDGKVYKTYLGMTKSKKETIDKDIKTLLEQTGDSD
jgi:thiol-disulfide isomerase/thioredoxin